MMSSEMFASEEVIYFEGSSVEPTVYHPESHMRSYENVVYVPHMLSPVMLLEYIPVYYNYQTYEPYLINRSQVFYVPFVRQVSYTYFVPYYYRYSVPEVFESSTQSEDDTSSNSYQESSLDNSLSNELIYEDDLNSSSDETSVLSSPYSSNSYEDSEFSSGEELCDFSQGFVCGENIDSFDGKRDEDDESNTGWEYSQEVFNVEKERDLNHISPDRCENRINFDDRNDIESDDSSISLCVDEKMQDNFIGSENVEKSSLKNVEKERHLSRLSPDRCENYINFDDRNEIEPDVSSISLLVDEEMPENYIGLENVEESSLKNVEKERHLSRLSPDICENYINFDDRNEIEPDVSSISLLVDEEMPENYIGSENIQESSFKNVEKERHLSRLSPDRCENYINFDDRNEIEPDVSSIALLVDEEMPENYIGLENVEDSSLKNVEKERHLSRLSPDRCENYINFDDRNEIEPDVSSIALLVDEEMPENYIGLENVEDCSLKNVEKERHLSRLSPDRCENYINFDDRNEIEPDVSSIALLVDEEMPENYIGSENVQESSLKNVEKERHLSRLSPDICENYINFDDRNEIEPDVSSIALLVDEEMPENYIGLENVEDSSLKNVEKERHLSRLSPDRCENYINFDDRNEIEPDVSSIALLVDEEMPENYIGSENVQESSLKNVEKERHLSRLSPDICENYINFDDRNEIEPDVSSIALLVDEEMPENYIGLENVEDSSLKNVEKERHLSRLSPDRCENYINFDDRNEIEPDVSSIALLVDEEMPENYIGLENVEDSSLKNVEKERHLSRLSPDRCENYINFDDRNEIEPDVSSIALLVDEEMLENYIGSENVQESSLKNVEKERDVSGLSPDRCENDINFDDRNEIEPDKIYIGSENVEESFFKNVEKERDLSRLSPVRCENHIHFDDRNDNFSHDFQQMSVQSQEIMLQKPESLHNIDAIVPELFDDVNSESENDSDDDPEITLQDILVSDEYWKVKREAYMQKRRNRDLYRSCLEGDIYPKRSLPQVGTLATIFEDLPHPINEPYEDGLQRVEETEREDLPPLEVQRSNSSATTLLPKKKRFRKTKKFFSGLFRCFRPPP